MINKLGKLSISVIFVITIFQSPVDAGPFGLGLQAGDPGGVSFKYWMDSRTSIDGVVGFGFGRGGGLTVAGDYSVHWPNFTPVSQGKFLLGLGFGAFIRLDRISLGIRGKGFADYTFAPVPLNLFLEVAPTIVVVSPGLDIMGAFGIRWFFM